MKKSLILSLILSITISVAVWVYCSFFINSEIIDYTVNDTSRQLYTLLNISGVDYLQIVSESGYLINNISLPKNEHGARKEYLYADSFNSSVYISGYLYKDNKIDLFVDSYSMEGKFESRVFLIENTQQYRNHSFTVSISTPDNSVEVVEILDKKQIRLNLYNVVGNEKTVRLLTPAENIDIAASAKLPDAVFILDKDGNLFWTNESGKLNAVDIGEDVIYEMEQCGGNVLYYTDAVTLTGKIIYLYNDGQGVIETTQYIVTENKQYFTPGVKYEDLRHVRSTAVGNCVATNSEQNRIYYLCWDNSTGNREYNVYGFTVSQILLRSFLALVVSFVLCISVSLIIHRVFASRKILNKQIVTMFLIVVIVPVPVILLVNSYILSIMQRTIVDYMVELADYINTCIDGDYFEENGLDDDLINNILNFNNVKFSNKNVDIISSKNVLFEHFYKENYFKFDYCEIAKLKDNEYYYEYISNYKKGGLVKYSLDEKVLSSFKNKGKNDYVVTFSSTSATQWLEVTGFICNKKGEQVGYVQIVTDNSKIYDFTRISSIIVTILTELVTIIISVIYILILHKLLTPLKSIKNATTAIADGKIGTVITGGKTNDELQDISDSFNDMSLKLNKYFNSINLVSKAYEKFVPKDFFLLMGKDNIFDVESGERVQCILTFLVINVNDYNRNSEDDGFARINSIYSVVADKVAQKGGIIQSYDDDLILAIYRSQVNNAVETALEINERINSVLERSAATLSFTVQNKTAYIGVIGSHSTMKCISVSPAINLQYHINRILNRFKIGFIITEDAYVLLPPDLQANCRYIGTVGMLLPDAEQYDDKLYEVPDIYDAVEKKQKLSYKNDFDSALELYCSGEFKKSRSFFINVLRINRNDLLVKYYLDKIEERNGG